MLTRDDDAHGHRHGFASQMIPMSVVRLATFAAVLAAASAGVVAIVPEPRQRQPRNRHQASA
jgi:hypothetical protein